MYDIEKVLRTCKKMKIEPEQFVVKVAKVYGMDVKELTKKAEKEVWKRKKVKLVASRFKWVCPKCRVTNLINVAAKTVECDNCLEEFEVGDISYRSF